MSNAILTLGITAGKMGEPLKQIAEEPAQQRVERAKYVAFACLLAILCGFAVTRDSPDSQSGFDRALMVWLAFSVASGLVLRFPASGRYTEAFKESIPPAIVLSLTIGIKLAIIGLLSILAGKIEVPAYVSAVEIYIAAMTAFELVVLVVLILVVAIVTVAATGVASIASEIVASVGKRLLSVDSRRITKLTKLTKATLVLVVALYALWAIIK